MEAEFLRGRLPEHKMGRQLAKGDFPRGGSRTPAMAVMGLEESPGHTIGPGGLSRVDRRALAPIALSPVFHILSHGRDCRSPQSQRVAAGGKVPLKGDPRGEAEGGGGDQGLGPTRRVRRGWPARSRSVARHVRRSSAHSWYTAAGRGPPVEGGSEVEVS